MKQAPPPRTWRYKWSIALYRGASLLALKPLDPSGQPSLTAKQVTDTPACAVADPFLLRWEAGLYLFFEIVNATTGRGEIAYATSPDGVRWDYAGIVLREAFHLSYPQVFGWNGEVYMIPETRQAGQIRLYRAEPFPHRWRWIATLAEGPYADATIHHDGSWWWLFAQRGLDELCLFLADTPLGPWHPHPASPLWPGNRARTRPGGRLQLDQGRLLRFAQDAWPSYGSCLRAYHVQCLDPEHYHEQECTESPIFQATRSGWNALAMHHLDAIRWDDGDWLAVVDGATLGTC